MGLMFETMKRLIKKAGAKRVSADAAAALAATLNEESLLILHEAKDLAKHAGRKTVMKQDIKLAIKNLRHDE